MKKYKIGDKIIIKATKNCEKIGFIQNLIPNGKIIRLKTGELLKIRSTFIERYE